MNSVYVYIIYIVCCLVHVPIRMCLNGSISARTLTRPIVPRQELWHVIIPYKLICSTSGGHHCCAGSLTQRVSRPQRPQNLCLWGP